MKESELQVAVADYLRLRYPDALFHSDFGSGIKLTKGQAMKQKRQNGGRRGWPDMFIAEYKFDHWTNTPRWHGLFLELKADGNSPFKKDGTLKKDEHLEEQEEMLEALRSRGYMAKFAVGFEQAKQIIDDYLGGENDKAE